MTEPELTKDELLARDREMARIPGPVRRLIRMWRKYPDTPPHKIAGRVRSFERRRAKNKRAAASRRRNRP